jgi:Tfp pilus assembly protein PilX
MNFVRQLAINAFSSILEERGMALPLAMIVLIIFASLAALFAGLAITEPQVSSNFALSKQALSVADGGLEWARIQITNNPAFPTWQQAFNNVAGIQYSTAAAAAKADTAMADADWTPAAPATIANVPTTATRVRWTGVALGSGFFTVTVSSVDEAGVNYSALPNPPNDPNQLRLVSTGTTGTGTASVREIISPFTLPSSYFPGALSVRNNADLRGNSYVNGSDASGPDVPGVFATGVVTQGGSASIAGTPIPYEDSTTTPAAAANYFDQPGNVITQSQLDALKALARKNTNCAGANGCYFQGSQSFNPLPNGIVVVDTTDGGAITPSNRATVEVNGTNSPSNTWLIVLGDVSVHGHISIRGLVYAYGTLNLRGMGSGTGILGAVVGLAEATVDVEANLTGNSKINFSLAAAGTPPTGSVSYLVKSGSWGQICQPGATCSSLSLAQ